MTGYIEKTTFKNGDVKYFVDMKCIACNHEIYGFYDEIIDINKCSYCKSNNVRTFNPDLE